MFRRAFRAEGRAFVRFDLPLQNQTTKALGGFVNVIFRHAEFLLGVECGVGLVQTEAALRDFTDAAPFARDDAEHLANQFLRGLVAFAAHRTRVLIFDLRPAGFQLLHNHQHALQNIQRLKAGHHNRHMVFCRDGKILLESHHGADVPGGEKALHLAVRRRQQRLHRRRHQHV